ncbi:DsbA family protein [Phenylobacterium sp.]|uniref:DsbA family protein n=1 Tax=Phenylobacterium sp. TaxID=1871053 RepID=UPI00301D928E
MRGGSGVGRWLGRRPTLSLALALGAGLLVSLALRMMPPDGPVLTRTPVVAAVLDDAGSPRSGAARPDVVVVVFTDYRCGVCKRTDPALRRLLADDPGVQVVWKDWPIRGEESVFAARVALAAHRQGRYDAVHDALMAATGALTPERSLAVAAAAGADPRRLATDLEIHAQALDRQIGDHNAQAFGLGLQGTPSYVVGPYLLQGGLDDGALVAAVRRARRAGPPKAP